MEKFIVGLHPKAQRLRHIDVRVTATPANGQEKHNAAGFQANSQTSCATPGRYDVPGSYGSSSVGGSGDCGFSVDGVVLEAARIAPCYRFFSEFLKENWRAGRSGGNHLPALRP